MAYPAASSTPVLSGGMIPKLWGQKLMPAFYQATYLSDITQTDYVSEIKQYGDSIVVNNLPDMKLNDYVNGVELTVDTPVPTNVTMYIDKGKYFCFIVPKIDEKQSKIPYIGQWATHSAKQLAIAIERDFYASIYTEASAYNKGATAGKVSGNINMGVLGTPLALTVDTVLTMILGAAQCMDEQDVPKDGRYIVIPPWVETLLKESPLKAAYLTGDPKSTYRTGVVGTVNNMTIYTSNLLTKGVDSDNTTAVWHILAGQKSGAAFAYQLVENESFVSQKTFGTVQRGLMVYGWKGMRPEALVDIYVKKG